ncbi:MAG TPA: MMPL family transporter, partial [Terrimesophilobacter sp.]|nr:MMPL family transporter [Terrimesophilobacter sp.]
MARDRLRRTPRWLRVLLPAVLILAWVGIAGIGGPYFGKVDEVSSNDQTSYLPASADATQVSQLRADFAGNEAIPAIVLYVRQSGLTPDDLTRISEAATSFASIDGVAGDVSPAIPSEDKKAAEVFVPIGSDAQVTDAVELLRQAVADSTPDGMRSYVTGPAGYTADLVDAFGGIDGILLLVALIAVLVILIIVYRSPLLPLIVLGTSMFALCASILTV